MISNVIRTCFPVAALAVADKAEEISQAQRFPVPDGTPALTCPPALGTVVREVQIFPQDTEACRILQRQSLHGSLMGARGNSGVITSQVLRGIAEGL